MQSFDENFQYIFMLCVFNLVRTCSRNLLVSPPKIVTFA